MQSVLTKWGLDEDRFRISCSAVEPKFHVSMYVLPFSPRLMPHYTNHLCKTTHINKFSVVGHTSHRLAARRLINGSRMLLQEPPHRSSWSQNPTTVQGVTAIQAIPRQSIV